MGRVRSRWPASNTVSTELGRGVDGEGRDPPLQLGDGHRLVGGQDGHACVVILIKPHTRTTIGIEFNPSTILETHGALVSDSGVKNIIRSAK